MNSAGPQPISFKACSLLLCLPHDDCPALLNNLVYVHTFFLFRCSSVACMKRKKSSKIMLQVTARTGNSITVFKSTWLIDSNIHEIQGMRDYEWKYQYSVTQYI